MGVNNKVELSHDSSTLLFFTRLTVWNAASSLKTYKAHFRNSFPKVQLGCTCFGVVTLTDWFNGYVDTETAYSLITRLQQRELRSEQYDNA